MNRVVSFQLMHTCSERCPYCYLPHRESFNDYSIFIKKFREVYNKMYDYMKERGLELVPSILGGEPTYWPYEVQEEILTIMEKTSRYLLFTNGFDANAPLFSSLKAVPYVHVIRYQNLREIQHALDICKDKKEFYLCVVFQKGFVEPLKLAMNYLRCQNMESHLYIQQCNGDEKVASDWEEMQEINKYSKVLGMSGGGDRPIFNPFPSPTHENRVSCFCNASLNVDIQDNKIYMCNYVRDGESLDALDIDDFVSKKKFVCDMIKCNNPLNTEESHD